MPDAGRCDLAVWDLHGELTAAVRRELSGVVRHTAPKLESVSGVWRGARVAVGWPRRLTAAQLPTIREALIGLRAVHPPRRIVIVGPAAAGSSGLEPGSVANLSESVGLITRWGEAAAEVSRDLEADAMLLAAVTRDGAVAPPNHRPTAARQAGRWLGGLLGDAKRVPEADCSAVVTEALAGLL